MNALYQRIARLIETQGPLSIAQFMTLALHDPKAGYYATRQPFGARGDFITAPEISQIFGELLGLWLAQCWQDQDSPPHFHLVELGPGRGTLMRDVLRAGRTVPGFCEAAEIVLVEASPGLTAIQRETLKDSGVSARWLTHLDESLENAPLYLLANEFFDALPVRQYVMSKDGWRERMVTEKNGTLDFALAAHPLKGLAVPEARGAAEPGAVFETSPAATAIAEEIAQTIAAKGGAALIADYGHMGNGFGETLQAVKGHDYTKVLEAPGEADISSHVDFAALAEAVKRARAFALGPADQGAFLDALGINIRAQLLSKANPKDAHVIASAVHRLTAPDQMGTLFKAMAILPESVPKPAGF